MFNKNVGINRKQRLRNSTAGFAVAIGVLSLIWAYIPVFSNEVSFSDTNVIIITIISTCLSIAFITLGVLFYRKDSKALAITLMVLFALYAVDRVYILIETGQLFTIFWFVLGIMAVVQLAQYLNIKEEQNVSPTLPPQPEGLYSTPHTEPQT